MKKIFDPGVEEVGMLFKNMFSIPVFQRPYSWEQTEILELLNDINNYFSKGEDEILFAGTIYLSSKRKVCSSIYEYDLIDGQQRITTLSLIFLVIYHHLNNYDLVKDRVFLNIKALLWKEINRNFNREDVLLTSGSIEASIIKYLFDSAFDNPNNFIQNIKNYECTNVLEQKVIRNVLFINKYLMENILNDSDVDVKTNKLLDFSNYIYNNINFIVIIVEKDDMKKLFEIFESINSKGKQLEQIDLIKSYIFQNIDDQDYNSYLVKWGELIKATNDNLENYIYIFIKAYIKFYKVGISAKYFKAMTEDLKYYYKVSDLSSALKCFIDDLKNKVKYYQILMDKNNYIIDNYKFKYYMKAMRLLEYEHPRTLLFRSLCEYGINNISRDELIKVVRNSFVFMYCFQTISNRDSKDAIKTFEKIMNNIYQNGFGVKRISQIFEDDLILSGIDSGAIKNLIINFIGYNLTNEKMATRVLLANYEFYNRERQCLDYDKAVLVLDKKEIQVDHILPQNPDADDKDCYYYSETVDNIKRLRLKKGHDFVYPGINENMDYELFKAQILNKIGNLRFSWRVDNIDKSNSIIELPDYSKFNKFKHINDRASDIAGLLYDKDIFKIEK